MKHFSRRILISRTDSIGDVILTLPIAKLLKNNFRDVYIGFLGKQYTQAVIEACSSIDEFVEEEDFMNNQSGGWDTIIHVFPKKSIAQKAKQYGIKTRIGTTNRLYHWWTCNKLVKLSRKNSDLHEAQLNLKLVAPLNIPFDYSVKEISQWSILDKPKNLPEQLKAMLLPGKYHLILHPKSQGSAREWGTGNFVQLIHQLDKTQFQIFISGTAKERAQLDDMFAQVKDQVTDITGMMNLGEFISFINQCDGLIANSTGPLHIAAALGIDAIGIYPPIRPMHPGRWAPIGEKAKVFVMNKECNDCRKDATSCLCIKSILPTDISAYLSTLI